MNFADINLDDYGPSGSSQSQPGQREKLQSLASQTPAVGPARQKALQAAAGQAVTASMQQSSDESQVQQLAAQVARMEKLLQDVMAYKQSVTTPKRAAATPHAASMATFTQDRLAVSLLPTTRSLFIRKDSNFLNCRCTEGVGRGQGPRLSTCPAQAMTKLLVAYIYFVSSSDCAL